jgi:hypothetical protein
MQWIAFRLRLLRTIVPWLRQACGIILLATAVQGKASDISPVKYAPPGAWVRPQFFDQQTLASSVDASADEHLLLWEKQINALQDETFFHSDRQILTLDGVQNGSTITINFNPNFQSLTFHWARIWRGGQYLDRLDTNKIQILQQEQGLDQYELNGEKSVVLVLDDVRVGDIIDYSYSIKGDNPVFGGHFSSEIPVQMGQPADRLLTRVIWPRQKVLYAKPHSCSVRPLTIAAKDAIEFTWDIRQAPGITLEDSLPDWFDPEPWVQLSDFGTWAEVNQWALALFQINSPFSTDLAAKIAEWKQIPYREGQILTVLQFVQEQVRYFGIEIGSSTEKPADPSTVFSRRFGDCKDKSLLFVTILRALGIPAYPVLVNSTLGRDIEGWQPSAGAFDHCIAEVVCNGQIYWVDPTMNYQRGPLALHYLPDYGCGLVIAPGTTGLTMIPQTTGLPETTTTEYFQIGRIGESSGLKVVTVAEGRDAETLRALYATTSLNDLEKNYTHFYADIYPEIKTSSPIEVEDDQQQNRFQTTEFYTIDKVWTQPENGKYECEFYPSIFDVLLKKPVDTDRIQPLGISFPEHRILRTEVTLPEEWPASSDEKTISTQTFTFRKVRRSGANRLVIEYDYQTLADSVSIDQTSDYLQQLDQCSQLLGNTLIWH